MTFAKQADIIAGLQSDILRLQGFKPANNVAIDFGLGALRDAFPNKTFPLGCVHEFLSSRIEDAAATKGFISGILGALMGSSGTSLWISTSPSIFPPALKNFGILPERLIFVTVQKDDDVFWVMDEALKCGALAAVIAEMHGISFTASRRFQLAVEQSQVTGFILRNSLRKVNTTACVSRWKVTSLASDPIEDLPGIGFPKWKVELLRIRNGRAGVWEIQWMNGGFKLFCNSNDQSTSFSTSPLSINERKAG
jgi:protein ImuA